MVVLAAALAACSRDRAAAADAAPEAAAAASGAPRAPVAASVAEPEPPPPRPAVDAAVAVVPPSAWVWKPYRGDHFSVLFPGEPKVNVLPAEEDKAGFSEALYDVPGGQVSFAAGFTEHSAEDVAKPDAFLDERANAPRRGFTEVLTKRSVTLPGGQPGRVLIQRRNLSGTPLRVYSRLYLVGRRLYTLVVSTLDVGGVSEDVVKKFMDSFKLLA
jgi:hypothetical protein